MSKPNQLFLLADHIKLSLLERQRAQSLHIDEADGGASTGGGGSQDGHIARSLDQFREGLDGLKEEEVRVREAGDENAALTISDALPSLQKQLDDLTSQFHGFSTPSTTSTLTHPNDPSLAPDFLHATQQPSTKQPSSSIRRTSTTPNNKSVRFSDSDLFDRYTDEPTPERDQQESNGMTNQQIHAYHSSVLDEQDEHLDRLGQSIGRQRELSMQMGDELEAQVELLDETDTMVDRHQNRLDRAQRHLGNVARAAGESKQMVAIVILIVILVMLIAVLK